MGTKYETTAQELGASAFKDAAKASRLLLDIVDHKVDSKVLEPLEDGVAEGIRNYIEIGLARIQAQAGAFAKFGGDLADDAEAAVTFILQKADEAIEAGAAGEPLMDTVAQLAKPYAIEALKHQQDRLAAIKIIAED